MKITASRFSGGAALAHAREIIGTISEGKLDEEHTLGEVGGVIRGNRRAPESTMLSRSLCIAAQDLYAQMLRTAPKVATRGLSRRYFHENI